jgi:uncharacterized protein YndB with AHSA1/START domain
MSRALTRPMTVSDSVLVAADAITLWSAISDPTQMPRWSPENTGARVGHEPRPLMTGETFVGSNSRRGMRWQTRCRVTASEPGERFEFRVGQIGVVRPILTASIATWRYTFEATPEGTLVTETWTDGRSSWPDSVARAFDRVATGGYTFADFQRKNIAATLAALQADFAGRSISG